MKSTQLKKIINSNAEIVKPVLGDMCMSFHLYSSDLGTVHVEVIKERLGVRFKIDGNVISAKKLDALNFKA